MSHVIIRQTGANEHRRVTMSMERCYWIYILASAIGGTLYIGVTNNLVRRVYEHKMGLADHKMGFADGFTKKYTFIGWYTSNNTMTSRLQLSVKSALRSGIGRGRFGSLKS